MDYLKRLLTHPMVKRMQMLAVGLVSMLVGCPVAFGMANEVTTTTISNDEATEYISDKTLRTALFKSAFYQFAEKHKLPAGEGRTFQVPRYEHVYLPQNPLSQGTTPANTAMTVSKVTAVAEQWGAVITLYDIPVLTVSHPLLQKAIDRLGVQAAKVFERETQRPLMACTNQQFINARASRASLVSTDVFNSLEIRKAVTNLNKNGTEKWVRTSNNTPKSYIQRLYPEGGGIKLAQPGMNVGASGLIGVVDTDVSQDIQNDSTFTNASSYSNIRALHQCEIGMWLGIVWIESNFMPNITLLTSPTVASANITGFSGGFSTSTAYDVVVTRISKSYGLEEAVSAVIDVSTDGSGDGLSVVLPSGASYMYRIYVGTDAGTCYLVPTAASAVSVAADDITGPAFEGGQTVYVTAIPTSGDTAPVAPASGVTVHVSWIFGLEAFGVVELDALKTYLTENKATDSDPLVQRRKCGWKAMFKAVVQNHNFIRKIESASNFAG